ncbi:MAG: hypothetical protein M1438_18675 [Deltaproteobacteria bacterium]|nr:hypothetical protein [Deltaproteobacteria bacterium]
MVNDNLPRKTGGQLSLYGERSSLVADPLPAMKIAIKEAIRRAKLSREQIVDAMNHLAVVAGIQRRISKDVLDKWTAPTAEERIIHLELLQLFCLATGDYLPLEVYVKAFPGVRLVSEERYRVLEWAEAEITARQAKKTAQKRAREVGIE